MSLSTHSSRFTINQYNSLLPSADCAVTNSSHAICLKSIGVLICFFSFNCARPPFAVDIKITLLHVTQLLNFNLYRVEGAEEDTFFLLCTYAGSYKRTVNCSWEAVRLPKLTEHISCRALPTARFALFSPVLKDAQRLDVAYNSTEISIIFLPNLYSGIFPNGTYYLPPSTVFLYFRFRSRFT